jgi:hypothetical protein
LEGEEDRREGPDFTRITWEIYKKEKLEREFLLSNPKLRRKAVYNFESIVLQLFGSAGLHAMCM